MRALLLAVLLTACASIGTPYVPETDEHACSISPAYIQRWHLRREQSLEQVLRTACPRVERWHQAGRALPIVIDNGVRQERANYSELLVIHPSRVWKITVTDVVLVELAR